ncbi:hypothetical protein [Amycolatopsis sp. ATCC 39116]|uniref:hypothetical protein n=1 Tax=Amycolatopsis sp. (strain ATCC 39116 / 75iv2) TaxID=385957 RepID=UPI00026284FE|nr:hypothetical protein [Amycolatopsis sp. ATCC 39116]
MSGNHDVAVEIANLPDAVRGYEDIKPGNVAAYRDALTEALQRFRAQAKGGGAVLTAAVADELRA